MEQGHAAGRSGEPSQDRTRKGKLGPHPPDADQWGGQAGRLYVTCLSTYMLEVYYRHLPLYAQGAVTAVP